MTIFRIPAKTQPSKYRAAAAVHPSQKTSQKKGKDEVSPHSLWTEPPQTAEEKRQSEINLLVKNVSREYQAKNLNPCVGGKQFNGVTIADLITTIIRHGEKINGLSKRELVKCAEIQFDRHPFSVQSILHTAILFGKIKIDQGHYFINRAISKVA